jgi:RimJ/RimL family protein N-acetyltransferase
VSDYQIRAIQDDSWLSSVLRRDSFVLHINPEWIESVSKAESKEKRQFDDLLSQKVFIQAKVDVLDLKAIALLEECGFRLIDTNIVFGRAMFRGVQGGIKTNIRLAGKADIASVGELGRSNFVYSRFHLDPQISVETANELKSSWALNYFKGKRGDYLFVAEKDNVIVGFSQVILGDDSVCIDLIAVDNDFTRQGIASDLIKKTESICGDKERVVVGTQISNAPSISLYEKLGFSICSSKYVLHYHNL